MRLILSIAVLLAGAFPALAQSGCTEPQAPPPIDGAQASADQLRTAMAQSRDYMAQAQLYQSCLQQSGDPDSKTLIAASQKAQDRVGLSINAAVDTYKKSHAN